MYSNGDVFDGVFHSGHIEGKGKLTCQHNGVQFTGEFKNSLVSCSLPYVTVDSLLIISLLDNSIFLSFVLVILFCILSFNSVMATGQ